MAEVIGVMMEELEMENGEMDFPMFSGPHKVDLPRLCMDGSMLVLSMSKRPVRGLRMPETS